MALLVLGAGGLAGCTFEPGQWFGTLTPRLGASLGSPVDRDAGAGWQKLSNDYQVKVSGAVLELGEITLLGNAVSAGSGASGFDPAHPPAGYTLCHNGHCHSTDGRLVPYAEIAASLGGGGSAALPPVVMLPSGGPFDLLVPVERQLPCQPSCGLGRVHILRASVPLRALVIEATARDGRSPPRLVGEIPFRWQLPAAVAAAAQGPPVLEAELDLSVDEEHPPEVQLRLQLELGAALLDGLELAQAPGGPAIDERILSNLRESKFLTASITRGD